MRKHLYKFYRLEAETYYKNGAFSFFYSPIKLIVSKLIKLCNTFSWSHTQAQKKNSIQLGLSIDFFDRIHNSLVPTNSSILVPKVPNLGTGAFWAQIFHRVKNRYQAFSKATM